jgi:hypothetical protein
VSRRAGLVDQGPVHLRPARLTGRRPQVASQPKKESPSPAPSPRKQAKTAGPAPAGSSKAGVKGPSPEARTLALGADLVSQVPPPPPAYPP